MSFLFQLRPFSQVVRRLQISQFSSSPVFYYDKEIRSETFSTVNKKFFVDIKLNETSGRYLKISELAKVIFVINIFILLYFVNKQNLNNYYKLNTQ